MLVVFLFEKQRKENVIFCLRPGHVVEVESCTAATKSSCRGRRVDYYCIRVTKGRARLNTTLP